MQGYQYMLLLTGRSLGQMMSRSSGSMSRARMCWLVLDLMHAGMSLNIVDRAFLLLRSREKAWRRVTQYFFLLQFSR